MSAVLPSGTQQPRNPPTPTFFNQGIHVVGSSPIWDATTAKSAHPDLSNQKLHTTAGFSLHQKYDKITLVGYSHNNSESPYLSIILPAHNEETRLPETLDAIAQYLAARGFPSELIIVENASSDTTLAIANEFAARTTNCRVLSEPVPGKGNAVRTGMLAAGGSLRFICDADLSMSIDQLDLFLPPVREGYDIAIASREGPGAKRIDEPHYRHLIGRVFNTMVRWLTLPGLQDTQCGFKCFTAQAAEALFPLQTMNGWTFDVEILAIARRRGYRVVEVPIHWRYFPGSKIRVLRDSFKMAVDLITIRRRLRRGEYDQPR